MQCQAFLIKIMQWCKISKAHIGESRISEAIIVIPLSYFKLWAANCHSIFLICMTYTLWKKLADFPRCSRPHPNRSVRPLKSVSKCWLWQSDPWVGTTEHLAILCSAWDRQDSAEHRTDGAHKKQHRATRQNSTNAWVIQACALT
jgi:hypothetical protein